MKVSLAHALGTACAACLSVVLTVNPSQAGGGQFVANPVAAAESELTLIGQNPEAIARIRQLNAEWDQAVADRDLDRLVDFFAADATTLPAHTPARSDHEGIREYWGQFLQLPGLVFITQDSVIQVADSGELACVVGDYRLGFDTPDGRIEDQGKYVLIYTLVEGDWKLAFDIDNSNFPIASN